MDIFGSLPSIHFSIFPVAKAPNILCKNTHKNPLCDNAALLQTVLTLLQRQGNKSLSKSVKNKLQKKYLAKASLVNLNKIHAPPADTVFYQVASDALYEMCFIRKDLPSVPIRSLSVMVSKNKKYETKSGHPGFLEGMTMIGFIHKAITKRLHIHSLILFL